MPLFRKSKIWRKFGRNLGTKGALNKFNFSGDWTSECKITSRQYDNDNYDKAMCNFEQYFELFVDVPFLTKFG